MVRGELVLCKLIRKGRYHEKLDHHRKTERSAAVCTGFRRFRKAGKTLMRYGSGLKCGCGFSMYTSVGLDRKELTETELEQLLNGETIYVDNLRSKKGKYLCSGYPLIMGREI